MKVRKYIVVLLTFIMMFSLAACGGNKEESLSNSGETGAYSSISKGEGLKDKNSKAEETAAEESGSEESEEDDIYSVIFEQDTYWTGYLLKDAFGAEDLPADYKWIDLLLWADGRAQLREVQNEFVLQNDLMLHMRWELQGECLGLYVEGFDDPYCQGTVDEEGIALEYYGSTLYMKQEVLPQEAGELLSPAQLTGTWVLASGEVEGDVWDAREESMYGVLFFNSVWDEKIAGITLQADYENRTAWGEIRESFYEQKLTLLEEPIYEGCGNERWSVRIGQESPLNENGYPTETDYYVTLLDENTLLLQQYYTFDGGPGVSYTYFKRILPTISVWEMETEELEGGDWDVVSFTDRDGKKHTTVPGMKDLYVHLDVQGWCSVAWEDESTGEYVSGDAQWILGKGGGLLIYQEDGEDIWFSGAVLMHNIETAEESIYQKEMYLYYAGGIIKLVHADGSGGENFDGESASEDYQEDYLYLEQMAYNAEDGTLLILYGDAFLDMGVYAELPHYNCSENGENSHNILITALYDGTEIYLVDEGGNETPVDTLNAFESMVLRMDIPESTEQYLGFWADGESFIYDINRDSIDVEDWLYLTR